MMNSGGEVEAFLNEEEDRKSETGGLESQPPLTHLASVQNFPTFHEVEFMFSDHTCPNEKSPALTDLSPPRVSHIDGGAGCHCALNFDDDLA